MANYLVGPNELYKEVQDAINALFQAQGTDEFTEEHNITIVESGEYAAFEIGPAQKFRPTSTYRLVIGAANGILPIIDATKTQMLTGSFGNGCLVSDGIKYLTIRRMYFRGFQKGIVLGTNCHHALIERNVVLDIENTGVWVYQSDQCQVVNNTIFNAKYGIVSTLVRDFAVLYNTSFVLIIGAGSSIF